MATINTDKVKKLFMFYHLYDYLFSENVSPICFEANVLSYS